MTGGLLSGGIIFVLAAALWLVYLVPTWFRRSEYLATERNAVRLQQTMRILAETSEIPDEVRLELTAREVAEKQRVLRELRAAQLKRVRADALAEATARPTVVVEPVPTVEKSGRPAVTASPAPAARTATTVSKQSVVSSVARSRRRARLSTTCVMVVSFVLAVVGASVWASTGAAVLFSASAITSVACVALLTRMARIGTRTPVASVTPVAAPVQQAFEPVAFDEAEQPAMRWTPTPLPRPLYQSQGSAAADAMAQADAHAELRRAALAQVMAQRAAELAPPVPTIAPRPSVEEPATASVEPMVPVAEAPSRFAGMGIVDESEIARTTNVSDLMRRRRLAS
ncbi:hypothetical protein GCM10027416_09660 [Okibacterium endophyticum]